jgi:hypothetical protein
MQLKNISSNPWATGKIWVITRAQLKKHQLQSNYTFHISLDLETNQMIKSPTYTFHISLDLETNQMIKSTNT